MSISNDYLKRLDLNPAAGGPVVGPLDPRALHMFDFEAAGQEVTNIGVNYTVFVSFDYAYDQGLGLPLPQLPLVHAVLAPGQSVRRESHARGHVLVWIDPGAAPQPGVGAPVQVSAWL